MIILCTLLNVKYKNKLTEKKNVKYKNKSN